MNSDPIKQFNFYNITIIYVESETINLIVINRIKKLCDGIIIFAQFTDDIREGLLKNFVINLKFRSAIRDKFYYIEIGKIWISQKIKWQSICIYESEPNNSFSLVMPKINE